MIVAAPVFYMWWEFLNKQSASPSASCFFASVCLLPAELVLQLSSSIPLIVEELEIAPAILSLKFKQHMHTLISDTVVYKVIDIFMTSIGS